MKSYEIEKIFTSRPTKYRDMKFLIWWKGYKSEEDMWKSQPELENA